MFSATSTRRSTASRLSARPRELRADVDVQTGDVEPCCSRQPDRGDRVVGDEPELRLGVCRPDRACVSASMPGVRRTRTVSTPAACARASSSSASSTTSAARSGGSSELLVGLVVAVEDEPVAGNACAQRELQLTERRDVGAEPFRGEEPQQRDVRERLRPVHDERVRFHARVRARARENGVPAVDDERRAELAGECRRADAADDQLAVLDGGRVGEELDQPVRRLTRSTSPASSRRRPGPCSGRRRDELRAFVAGLERSDRVAGARGPRPTASGPRTSSSIFMRRAAADEDVDLFLLLVLVPEREADSPGPRCR